MRSGLRETKTIDGEEHYQLGVTEEWVPAHPVPELHRGMVFFTTMYPSPVFVVEGNDPEELERHPTHLPGGIPERGEVGEYWLLYIPSSGSEPLRWRRGDDIRRHFQAGQYKLEPTEMAEERGIDSETWWQAVVQRNMTDYDFIDPDLPERRNEENNDIQTVDLEENYPELRNRALVVSSLNEFEATEDTGINADEIVEELEENTETDKVAEENNTEDNRGFLGRAYNQLKNAL